MGLDLYYGDRKVAVLRARCTAIETSSLRPVLTYVDQSALENKRENFFRARKLLRLQRDYRKGREPAAEIDPYLVAIMIAMARAASESYRKKGIEKPSFQVARLSVLSSIANKRRRSILSPQPKIRNPSSVIAPTSQQST